MMCLNPIFVWGHNSHFSALDHGLYNPWYLGEIGKFYRFSNMNNVGTI